MGKIEQEIEFLDKKRVGYKMLKEAIYYILTENNKAVFYKDVYPYVAQRFKKNPSSVERDIRYVLKKSGCKVSCKKFIKGVVNKALN